MSGDDEDLREEIVVAREQDRAFELFAQGKDFRFIAQDIGRSVSTAHKRVQDALHKAREARVRSYVDVELAMYQDIQRRLYERLEMGVAPERIAPHLLALSKERRRLMGEDAPKRLRVSVEDDVTIPDVGFARVVEEAERAAAAEEADIREHRDAG